MVIDYSKWDRMDFDDDEEDSDNGDDDAPHVTALDRPGRVTIGPAGSAIELLGDDDLANKSTNKELSTSKKPKIGDGIGGVRVGDVHDNQPQLLLQDDDGKSKIHSHGDGGNTTKQDHRKRSRITRNGGMHHRKVVFVVPDHEQHDKATNSHHHGDNSDDNNTRTGREIIIYWSQDRYAVTVRVGIDPTIFAPRNIRVKCKGALSYIDRHSAVGSGGSFGGDDGESHGSIEIVCIDDGTIIRGGGGGENIFVGDSGGRNDERNGKAMPKASTAAVLLSERLCRPIHLNEGEDELDFEIEDCSSDDIEFDNNLQYHNAELDDNDRNEPLLKQQQQQHASTTTVTKFVTIVLPKAVPMIGMTYWWDKLFVGYPTIDMDTIVRSERMGEEDKNNNNGINSRTKTEGDGKQKAGEAFRQAWEGAHAAFREKMKTRERQSIDIGE